MFPRSKLPTPLVLSVLLLIGCSAARSETTLTVFAASSLTDVFDEIGTAFENTHPDVHVIYNYGGSSQLATQILEGARADVFASANDAQMQRLIDEHHLEGHSQFFASNRLVIIVPASSPAGITSLDDLDKPGVRLLLAVPGVPVRDYADQVITSLDQNPAISTFHADQVYANLVSEEDNVRQVAAKVALGEADAGIVYSSDVTPDLALSVKRIEIPDSRNIVAMYPIGQPVGSSQVAIAQEYIAFVLSAEGQAILARWGFAPPSNE
jgi:molybdate transport system substrate-binding protein